MNKSTKKPAPPAGDIQSFKDYCEQYFPRERKRCPHPNCPENDRPEHPYGKCTLHEPIWISIPAGGHIHITCPVHSNGHILYGDRFTPRATWGPEDFYKSAVEPDYSKMGKVWM